MKRLTSSILTTLSTYKIHIKSGVSYIHGGIRPVLSRNKERKKKKQTKKLPPVESLLMQIGEVPRFHVASQRMPELTKGGWCIT